MSTDSDSELEQSSISRSSSGGSDRPTSLHISPCRRLQSKPATARAIPSQQQQQQQQQQCRRTQSAEQQQESYMQTDSSYMQTDSCSGFHHVDYLSDDLLISKLMSELAEKDEHYEGMVEEDSSCCPESSSSSSSPSSSPSLSSFSESPSSSFKDDKGPPQPQLIVHDVSKDGPGPLKRAKKLFVALRIKKGEKSLSLASNKPLDSEHPSLYVYHNSGSPSPGLSILSLNPAQSPHLSPLYDPNHITYGQVITFSPSKVEVPSPGTYAVKVESKTHVYLALDYTDESHPKLLAIEEIVLGKMLIDSSQGKAASSSSISGGSGSGGGGGSGKKIKPIVNVRKFPGTRSRNNTAFYFKTEKNYHFVVVNEKTLHLEVHMVPVARKTKETYRQYLSFGPLQAEAAVGVDGTDHVDGGISPPPVVKKTAIPASPLMSDGGGSDEQDTSKKLDDASSDHVATTPSDKSTPSDTVTTPTDRFKQQQYDGVTSGDSGVEEGPKESNQEQDEFLAC